MCVCLGILITFALGLVDINTDSERITFIELIFGIPIAISALNMFLLLTIFNYDSPPMMYKKGEMEKLNKYMGKMYHKDYVQSRINGLKPTDDNLETKSEALSLREVFFGVRYGRSSMVGCVLAIIQQMCGINVIIFYSNSIFTSIEPKIVTFMVGAINFISAIGGSFLLSKFGRRSIVLICQFLMAADLIILGWCG